MEYKAERKEYSKLKNSGLSILTNIMNLRTDKKSALDSILEEHIVLAVFYAMKEEKPRL